MTRPRLALTASLAVVALAGCAPQPAGTPPATAPAATAPAGVGTAATPSQTPAPSSASPRGDQAPVIAQGPVVDVVDGDTVDLADGTRVRLAIVDTPEVHGQVEPCGPEASAFTGRFLDGQTVAVYRPDTGPATDPYGRTLGEVVRLSDGASLNVALYKEGLAEFADRYASEDPDLTGRLQAVSPSAPDCQG